MPLLLAVFCASCGPTATSFQNAGGSNASHVGELDFDAKVAKCIAEIRNTQSGQRSKLAKAERISVDRAIVKTDQMIQQRETARRKLTGSQAADLAVEIRKAKSERAQLASHRTKLASFERVAER